MGDQAPSTKESPQWAIENDTALSISPKLMVFEQAEKLLQNQAQHTSDEPLNLVSIFGGARQGKSFLMNMLGWGSTSGEAGELGEPVPNQAAKGDAYSKDEAALEVQAECEKLWDRGSVSSPLPPDFDVSAAPIFGVSNKQQPCTQGVDLSPVFLTLKEFSSTLACDSRQSRGRENGSVVSVDNNTDDAAVCSGSTENTTASHDDDDDETSDADDCARGDTSVYIGLVDTEGQGDRDVEHDTLLVSPLVLLRYFLYNTG
jgi:hypothetical protein